MSDQQQQAASRAAFREGFVEADGFRIRYMEAGQGAPLVHLHGAGGMRLTPAHDLLAARYRVIAFEMPGFGAVAGEHPDPHDGRNWRRRWSSAVDALGLDQFDLMGTSFGGKAALWLAVQQPERVPALVLEAPAAIRPAGNSAAVAGTPEEMARRLYAHPGAASPPLPADRPGGAGEAAALVARLRGPDRDADLEAAMRRLDDADPGAVRHARPRDPARDGPLLQGAAAELPSRARLRCRARDRRRAAGGFCRGRRPISSNATRRS